MNSIHAEIIAIGDELTSGFRLDTNTQWLSQQLENIGIPVAFHATTSDDLECMISVFETASRRSHIVVMTGGLGPTADDLTRHVLADLAQVELKQDTMVLDHIKRMFKTRNREMTPNNLVQALFPEGSLVIPNPEGTAPGIEQVFRSTDSTLPECRMFALPGVPAEMKQMWNTYVLPRLRDLHNIQLTTHHHLIHCFGTGESAIEAMLPDMIKRGRDPLVGITASAATITLRVSTKAPSIDDCIEKMMPTIDHIKDTLDTLVYGENGVQLEDVIVKVHQFFGKQMTVIDAGLHGEVARLVSQADETRTVLAGGAVHSVDEESFRDLVQEFKSIICENQTLVAIGPIDRTPELVEAGDSYFDLLLATTAGVEEKRIRYSGHSAWREVRAVKDVLNTIRLRM